MLAPDRAVLYQSDYSAGSIIVKEMEPADAQFAGSMQVDAFQSKFENAVGPENLQICRNGAVTEISTRPPEGYNNNYIAWYNGERAGFMCVSFHGDKSHHGDESYSGLGCWSACRLTCLALAIGDEKVPRGLCYLNVICVDERFRGKGIGKVLMEKAESEARAHQCHGIYLWVASENRARHLYERQGFAVVQEESSCFMRCSTGIEEFCKMQKML